MEKFKQEIKEHNLNRALAIETVGRISDEDFIKAIDEVADTLNKSFLDGLIDEQAVEVDFKNLDAIIEKARPHKYYKREGSPGNYKYYYTKEGYEKKKKKVEEGKEGLRGFPHKEEYAHGEVRSFKEFKELKNSLPEYFLVDLKNKKIVAGYAAYNVPNYGIYTGNKNKSGYEIWHRSTMKNPDPYLNQFPLDYEDENNWLT